MNKVLKVLLSMILVLSFNRVFAETITITYSDWSTYYPNGIPEEFIETENRYHFYRIVDGQVEYDNGYYTDLAGYIKDEGSERPYFRYITNPYLLFNMENEMVLSTNACDKSFCYIVYNSEPTMVNTVGKFEPNYEEVQKPVVTKETVPFTGDNLVYYVAILLFSIFTVLAVVLVKRHKTKQLIRA